MSTTAALNMDYCCRAKFSGLFRSVKRLAVWAQRMVGATALRIVARLARLADRMVGGRIVNNCCET
jgi:hypothetical protein